VLTDEQRAELERDGVVKLPAAFPLATARRMQDVVWNELRRRYEIEREDPATWDRHPPVGLKSSKRSRAFEPLADGIIATALDDLFGSDGWIPPKAFGNVLVTMPNATEWRVPHRIWHSDFEATASPDALFAVKVWALFDDVEPRGGGTPQLVGSHRSFAQYLQTADDHSYKAAKFGFLRSHPFLRSLTRDAGEPDRNQRFMDASTDVDGVPVRVIECTGQAGDVYLTHPWVFHSIAVNARTRPRLMRSFAVWRRTSDG
jgi:hypothetical protein